jgi:hypothetical protein
VASPELPPKITLKSSPQPTNLLHVMQVRHPITGNWVIDPSLHVDNSLLVPIYIEDNAWKGRPNLKLQACKGPVDADIQIVGRSQYGDSDNGHAPIVLDVYGCQGDVTVKVVSLHYTQQRSDHTLPSSYRKRCHSASLSSKWLHNMVQSQFTSQIASPVHCTTSVPKEPPASPHV